LVRQWQARGVQDWFFCVRGSSVAIRSMDTDTEAKLSFQHWSGASTNIALARGESLRVAITNIGPRATQRRRAPIQSCSLAIELAGLVVACHLLVELGYSSSSLHGSDTGTLSTGSRLK